MEKTKRKDFIELEYEGYANGELFDSNIPEKLKKLDPKAEPKKMIISIGAEMVLKGLDNALIDKEVGKEYEINIPAKDAFGERKRDLVKTIPLKVFKEKNVNPQPGMPLYLDNYMVKVIAISGARVITDFNNPLSGKEIQYKFTIKRIVTEEKEKVEGVFQYFLGFIPEFEVNEKITLKAKKEMEPMVTHLGEKFKELIGKELAFQEIKEETPEVKQETKL